MKILLVEDNRNLALNITEYLEVKEHIVDYSDDGSLVMNLLLSNSYDVIVLDIMLPGQNGFSICEKLRESDHYLTPVVIVSAKDTEEDKLKAFGVGADDYVVKPFSLPELEARIIALARRSRQSTTSNKELVVGDLVYNPSTMSLKRGDTNLYLKPIPREILIMLMQNANRVVTRHEIEQVIWNDSPPNSEVLRSHIYAIRSEINKNKNYNLLTTVRGVGYIIGESE